ncbi:TPA: hypothetical protein ACIAIE_005431 [Serratia fonticola]
MAFDINATEVKDVWLVVTNSDLTEGRGLPVILFACDNPVTAERLARKQGVMGSDANVEKSNAYKICNHWFSRGAIQAASQQDKLIYATRLERNAVIEKMREKGFSEEEISALK